MNLDDFMEGIHRIQDNYHKKFTTSQLKIFYEHLKDMPKDRYLANIEKHIQTNTFMPNIAQIRSEGYSKQYSNYEQRDYNDMDFDRLLANQGG